MAEQISLVGPTSTQIDGVPVCVHHWDIETPGDINPETGLMYGNPTPGTCRKCREKRSFSSKVSNTPKAKAK